MPEGLLAALAMPGLWALLGLSGLAGIVYGFAGFGAALIFMPVAVSMVAPNLAIAAFQVSALSSLFTVVPQAWRVADKPAVITFLVAATVTFPLGILVLRVWDQTSLQWLVSGVVGVTLVSLMFGLRWRAAPVGLAMRLGIGGATGVVGGATGITGPVVILFNLGSGTRAAVTRANTLCFLTLSSVALLVHLWLQGLLTAQSLWLGAMLAIPYGLGNRFGQALFDPAREVLYRRVAYAIIGLSALVGLPIWT